MKRKTKKDLVLLNISPEQKAYLQEVAEMTGLTIDLVATVILACGILREVKAMKDNAK